MATCHDPYREVEIYLEQAQEEIGKAFEELMQYEESFSQPPCKSWNNVEAVLPPPPAFRSQTSCAFCCDRFSGKSKYNANSVNFMNRVCHDGNVRDLQNSPEMRSESELTCCLQKSPSYSDTEPYFSKIGTDIRTPHEGQHYANGSLPTHDKRFCKQLRPSLSLPEGSMNTFGREKLLYDHESHTEIVPHENRTQISKSSSRKPKYLRQRSLSDTPPPSQVDASYSDENCYSFPRPPSSDVNLLAIWADNLVIAIDKSLSGELNGSVGSSSPLSEYGSSPTKPENEGRIQNFSNNYDLKPGLSDKDARAYADDRHFVHSNNGKFKFMSLSPDSGIGQACDMNDEDAIDGTSKYPKNFIADMDLSVKARNDLLQRTEFQIDECITPPPPEFEDDDKKSGFRFTGTKFSEHALHTSHSHVETTLNDKPVEKRNVETQVNKHVLKVASSFAFVPDGFLLGLDNRPLETHRRARVVPLVSVDLEDCATLTTTCAVCETSWSSVKSGENAACKILSAKPPNDGKYKDRRSTFKSSYDVLSASDTGSDNAIQSTSGTENEYIDNVLDGGVSTLPKPVNHSKQTEHFSSLPRDTGRIPPGRLQDSHQRSSSSSAVSSVSQVSMVELAAFMRKVQKSTYYPPPRADVSVDVKNDDDVFLEDSNRDAVTQTTPVVPLSRSSSFTWVTECDCTDFDSSDARSCSEGSLLVFSCSNSTSENKMAQTSSSPSLSTDDDGCEAPQNSCCSSLYLSACSDISDSSINDTSREDSPTLEVAVIKELHKERRPKLEHFHAAVAGLINSTSSDKSLSSAGTLVDIAEEESVANETLSVLSVRSSQSDDRSCTEQSASFPSTLKPIPKSKSDNNAAFLHQPIEANVLVINELTFKSVSAPVLRQKRHATKKNEISSSNESSPPTSGRSQGASSKKTELSAPLRAHSAKELNELQAIEACSWLRAAGFPQYAQMYEDHMFPVDICIVQKDHSFIHPDSMQSLFRRLNTLNRCARMKFDTSHRASLHLDDSDDEEQCALSENWEFQRVSKRWSRIPSCSQGSSECSPCIRTRSSSPSPRSAPSRQYLAPEEAAYCGSHDSVFVDEQHSSPDSFRRSRLRSSDEHCSPVLTSKESRNAPESISGSGGALNLGPEELPESSNQRDLHRSGSDRIREGAKALLRRMESLKGRKKKKNEDGKKAENSWNLSASGGANSGTDGSSCSSLTSSPMIDRQLRINVTTPHGMSDCIQGGTPQLKPRKKMFGLLSRGGDQDSGAHSDSECSLRLVSERWKDSNPNDAKGAKRYTAASQSSVKLAGASPVAQGGTTPKSHSLKAVAQEINSICACGESHKQKGKCIYSRCPHLLEGTKIAIKANNQDNCHAPLVAFNDACVEILDNDPCLSGKRGQQNGCAGAVGGNDGEIIIITNERRDSGVGASLTRVGNYSAIPWHSFQSQSPALKLSDNLIPVTSLTAAQMLVLRKLSLLKLTTVMEKFSPSSRAGWSWAMPKFISRIRTPDYKDKEVFGAPLLLVLERSGQPLPIPIQAAFRYLRKTALDSTGLFRKPGVRSRIQKLRVLCESNSDTITYEDQQAYDVADMLKQYFRELPEVLLTNKLSETFITIFQYIPSDLRLEAIQAAIMLMPDENREVLEALLSFLHEVCQHSAENQMTATNIAVCFAPSLFQLSSPRSASSSPRRRKTVGAPDMKELNENRAAYECLSAMVANYNSLCSIPESTFSQSRLQTMDSHEPAHLGDLSNVICNDAYGWKTYVDCCIQNILKEAKDKYKGWESVSQSNGIDLACKKVGDGYPLRLWKASTEVEAPPTELLNRVLRERHIWDKSFIKWRVIQTLEKQAEVFQFVSKTLPPQPPRDYCVIRAWKTDLPKGACILVEASVEHGDAKLMIEGSVRGIILGSRFLIEPCGSGKCRITHFCRLDTKGRSPEWYNRACGSVCAFNLGKLRESFSHGRAGGPETKV